MSNIILPILYSHWIALNRLTYWAKGEQKFPVSNTLRWRYNERDGASNHRRTQPFVQAQIKENIHWWPVEMFPRLTTEHVSIWWHHHDQKVIITHGVSWDISFTECAWQSQFHRAKTEKCDVLGTMLLLYMALECLINDRQPGTQNVFIVDRNDKKSFFFLIQTYFIA